MKKLIYCAILLFIVGFAQQTQAQVGKDEKDFFDKTPFSHLNVALRVSTLGAGIEFATPINDHFNLRTGINFFSYTAPQKKFSISDTPDGKFQTALGYVPDYVVLGKVGFVNGDVLVDYHPWKKGIFHITGGFFIGANNITADGWIVDAQGLPAKLIDAAKNKFPDVNIGDYALKISDNANLNAKLKIGRTIKPYFGLGLGRAVTKHRVGCKFELGMIYQSDYSFEQNGSPVPIKVVQLASDNVKDFNTYSSYLKWWPMINFQISYKLF